MQQQMFRLATSVPKAYGTSPDPAVSTSRFSLNNHLSSNGIQCGGNPCIAKLGTI